MMPVMTQSDGEKQLRERIANDILDYRDSQIDEAHQLGDYGTGFLSALMIAANIAEIGLHTPK